MVQGEPMPTLWYVADGEVEVIRDGKVVAVAKAGSGGWLGELWDPNEDPDYWQKPHAWRAGFRAKQHSLVVAFDRKKLHDFIARSHELRDAAAAAEVADLWGKLRNCHKQGTRNVYRAMVEMAHSDGELEPRESTALERFAVGNPGDLSPEARRAVHEALAQEAEAMLRPDVDAAPTEAEEPPAGVASS